MNQTRTLLIFAWLMVAMLLWMEWRKDPNVQASPAPPAPAEVRGDDALPPPAVADGSASVPDAPGVPAAPSVPVAPPAAGEVPVPDAAAQAEATRAGERITVATDVLRLTLENGNVIDAALLDYPQTRDEDSPPVKLFDTDPARWYTAQSGWVSRDHAAPTHAAGFVAASGQREYRLDDAGQEVVVPFIWRGPDGVSIERTMTLRRGSYAIEVRDTVTNAGNQAWNGAPYRQLVRVAPPLERGMTNPESFSFIGAAFFDGSYQRRTFREGFFTGSFLVEGENNVTTPGGWVAMLQHHFFAAWIPNQQQRNTIQVDRLADGRGSYLIRVTDEASTVVQQGQSTTSEGLLWVGPKRVDLIEGLDARGIGRVVDYSRFTPMAWLGEWLFWLLDKIHSVVKNWGWAIIGLVVVIKLAMYPLSAAQYKSMAKMRRFQPRMAQLKERYGDDKQKFQMAMMELYKKEKINPVGGCLPILLQMPIFFALYWVLLESVELRHVPWMGWIQDLTAPDPFFILPIINIAVMWATQKLSPMTGMDPMQQKIMQLMPVIFGAIMIFFPAGLVLYWVTNGTLGLAQQWWFLRKYSGDPPKPDKPEGPSKPPRPARA